MPIPSACSAIPDTRALAFRSATSLLKALGILLAAVAGALCSLPAIAAPNCFFRATGTLNLAFGALDPSVGSTVMSTLTVGTFRSDQVGDCTSIAQTMTLTAGAGQNFVGGSRRLSSAGNFIRYSIGGAGGGWAGTGPWTRTKPGNNTWRQIPVLTATILGVDYQNAAAGTYSDTVTLTISP